MAVAAALVSSLTGSIIPPSVALFGEIALSGALRPVGQADQRAREAAKLGLETVITAAGGQGKKPSAAPSLRQMANVGDLVAYIAGLPKG
jgi:DNA repair protein RadA/Sms